MSESDQVEVGAGGTSGGKRWLNPRRLRALQRVRRIALILVLVAAIAFFGDHVNRFYPIEEWLFWVYARAWVAALCFGAACTSAGQALLRRCLGRTLPFAEHFALSFGLGVWLFGAVVFVAGLLHLLHPWFFFLAPLALLLLGASSTLCWLRRARRLLDARPVRRRRPGQRLLLQLIALSGCVGIAALYFLILTPDNVAYDARWYHLPLAEHYAARGAIEPSVEGWAFAAYPHFTSFLYTWAMLVPVDRYFDKVAICSHIEFVCFLATLVGVVASARRLLPRVRQPVAWVAMFVFPEIFLYDSTLSTGADHVAAMWAPLILIALLRTLREQSLRFAAVLAAMLGAAICTKFTAVLIALFPAFATLVWASWRAARPSPNVARLHYVKLLGIATVVGLAVTAPHWLKNLVWYENPLYPTLHHVFGGKPWTSEFSPPFENWFYSKDYHASRDWEGLRRTLWALVDYSFVPNDWPNLHGDVPVFGSLATLTLPCLLLLPHTRRLWLAQAAIHSGIFVWFSVHHFDRYLQTLLPWMAAVLSATCCLLWQQGFFTRVALGLLASLQAVWGGDVYFFPTHAMAGSAIKKSVDLLATGFQKNNSLRYTVPFQPYLEVARGLPRKATVLVHENHVHWALSRASISDWQGTQAGISYGRLSGVRETHALLKRLGVSHVYWDNGSSKGYDTLAADLNFFSLAEFVLLPGRRVGHQVIAPLPDSLPNEDFVNDRVLLLGCADNYANGVYRLNQLVASDHDPKRRYPSPEERLPREVPPAELDTAIDRAGLAVVDPGCYPQISNQVRSQGFEKIGRRTRIELFARPLVVKR
jgi:hypothetical protein